MRGVSLRLTHKISVIGVVGVVGVLLIGGIHLYGEIVRSAYRGAADNARAIAKLNDKIEVELLEGRRAEKDFLLRNDTAKADKQASIASSVVTDIEALRVKIVALGKAELAQKIQAMSESLAQYQAHFRSVVDLKRQLGLDEESGLEGKLRKSVHAIEAEVNQLHETGLLVTMLMMRRHEKDFM